MGDYFTKCGRKFEKSSASVTTGYRMADNDVQCHGDGAGQTPCPFRMDVKEGWPPVHKCWECRAGSKPPNHTTEWTGSLTDKNTIQIHSLDVALMEEIMSYCEAHPALGAAYNTDHLEDCRRTIAVHCISNKTGIAAKQELIAKFFPEKKQGCCPYYVGNNGIEIKCGEGVTLSYKTRPEQFNGQLEECRINYTGCRAYIFRTLESMGVDMKSRSWSTEEAAAELKKFTKKDDAACEESLTNTGSDSCASGTQEDTATSTVDKPTAMTARDSSGTEAESCANCQVNKDVCLAFQAAMSQGLRPEECLCDNWTMEEEETMKNENACPYGKLSCDCRCITSFDGQIVCDAIRRKDWDRYHYIKEMQPKVNCDIFDKLAAEIIAEKNGERLERQKNAAFLPENVTKTDEIVTFDYSIVDEETGAFLQEKAQRVTEIRFKSVLAMGREFKQAQEKLANNKTGVFQQWVKSIGFDPKTAYNYINGFDYIMENFHNIEDADSIQPSLLFAVSKPSARPELQQAVLAGDIKTHKEYKELEEKFHEAEARANEAVRLKYQADSAKIKAESEFKKLSSESANHIKDNLKTIRELNQQLDQAKRNSDPAKIQELGQIISDKQREIDDLRQQLKDKPIEATASRVVEKLPDDVQEYLSGVDSTIHHMQNFAKVNQVLNLVVGLSTEELQSWAAMMNNRKAVGDDEESETLELLGMAIQSLEDMKEDYESRGCE